MGMKKFMAAQLRQPSGLFGSLVMVRMMNRVNRKITERTLELLEVAPEHQVLEIGFGGGIGLELAAKLVSQGQVTGIDFSQDMVARAKKRFAAKIASGGVKVHQGTIVQMPFPGAAFDRVFTVNTIYFWPDTAKGLQEIRRVLKPGGLAAISIRSKEKMSNSARKRGITRHNFTLFSPEDVVGLMKEAGFKDVVCEHRDREHWYDQAIIVGKA